MPASAIYYNFGFARKIVAVPPVDRLEYTDDTQMMIGVAEALALDGEINQDNLMAAFVTNFDAARAYGPGTHQIIETAAGRGDWKALSASIFPGGSLGNGAAMRVLPIGLLFHDDLDRVEHEAVESALPTHSHPIGVDGARIMAIAVALMIRDGLGTSIEAHRSLPTALACFASYPDSYDDAVGRAIGLGGDVDTIAAMVGALCGAHLGLHAVPTHLLAMLEDGPKGRSYLDTLAQRLLAVRDGRIAITRS
jgi:poly(ADP-ribose) glycohydrolase ARH3